MIYEICVKPEKIKKHEIYIFKDNFKGQVSKALVKVINKTETSTHYKFLVRLLEIHQGIFRKNYFTIAINKRNDEFEQRFYERVMI
jgi:hypothetical protein